MEQAVELAYEKAHPGDVVLLAPGCTSFDMFDDFEHRGLVFKEGVNALGA
jgi:UDP-N-acetylmuramoylalanine--D-glutamate ligase